MAGNPYKRIFEIDEEIANANSLKELCQIQEQVWKSRKFSLNTIRMIMIWIIDAKGQLQGQPNYLLER